MAIIALSRPGMAVQSGFNRMARTVILAGFLGNMNRDSVRVDNMVIHLNAAAAVTFPEGSEAALDFACESAIGIPMNDAGEARP